VGEEEEEEEGVVVGYSGLEEDGNEEAEVRRSRAG